ncbi:MAG: bifunctional adenosylcobinamide kinase/adenosylcobinamide-phosphate guanylyltransferase [Desulfobacterales bacterium]|nr:bifunctional adenosylcobinamide kinase/adenosylcobinamide-phosphate guanylyltransferase [Desulfobacterales bacterium]
MKEISFIFGGCRSGKSSYALKTAEQISGNKKVFIATCVPLDDEMKNRVFMHQKQRGANWITIDAPLLLAETVADVCLSADVILIDCIGLWITNLLLSNEFEGNIFNKVENFIEVLKKINIPILIVSNEVGCGIVPENKLAREFRDILGFANQKIAECSDKVVLMAAGIPMVIKSQ